MLDNLILPDISGPTLDNYESDGNTITLAMTVTQVCESLKVYRASWGTGREP
jgi:hypothetical protein